MRKFKVGQKILLKSISSPELNGEYTILHRYIDDGEMLYEIGVVGNSGWDCWGESALAAAKNVIDPFDLANPL